MTTYRRKWLLIESGSKEHKCEVCNQKEWNGLPIPIELHHIDGNNSNNDDLNLQIICPNCHAQTDNYKSKNRTTSKHGKHLEESDLITALNSSKNVSAAIRLAGINGRSVFLREWCRKILLEGKASLLVEERSKSVNNKVCRKKTRCLDCEVGIEPHASRCRNCHLVKNESKIKPSKEILISEINEIGYLRVGKKYGVSDNAVRKWVKSFGLNPNEIRYNKYKRVVNSSGLGTRLESDGCQ